MSITTSKLGLIKPEVEDQKLQTINDIATSFQKIDDAYELKLVSPPSTGQLIQNTKFWNNAPVQGGYIGWVVTRSGTMAPKWTGLTSYSVGNKIIPSTDNGHVYECIQTGYSAVLEPTFPVSTGGEIQDTRGATTWRASTNYNQQDIVFPSIDNGRFYVCTVAGESGTFEPSWATANGIITPDGTAVWSSYRIARWKEAGVSAIIRPFGKIE